MVELPGRPRALGLLPWAFGFAPFLQILVTWGDHQQTWWIKSYALPIAIVELLIVIAAFLDGMRMPLTRASAFLAGLLALAWIAATLAPDLKRSMWTTDLWTLHILFGFAAARLFQPDVLVRAILAGFVASMAALAIFAATAPADFNWIYEIPGFGNPRSFAIYASVAIALSLGLLAAGRSWSAAIMAIGFTLAFWSGSRGATYVSAATLVLATVLFADLRRPRVWMLFIASILAGALAARIIGSPAMLSGVSRMVDVSDNRRLETWRETLNLIAQRPWFGWGEGQLEYLGDIIWTTHPHNIVLQILLAWGIVGLILAGGLAWWAAREVLRRVDAATLPPILAIICLGLYSLIDGALYNPHTVAIFAACLGVVLASPRQQARAKAEPLSAANGGDRAEYQ